ncbi:MAG: cupin domain-containing protein [Minisyncoccia bacterium]
MSYIAPVLKLAKENENFRTVLYTGKKSQLVLMAIPVGGDIGEEVHAHVEQTIALVEGEALSVLDGVKREVFAGDIVVVPPGTMHNFINNGAETLKLYTVYAPANHIDGRIHVTKADAEADVEDEAFGEKVPE